MRVIGSLQDRVCIVAFAAALFGLACRPTPLATPQPVARTPQLVPAPVSMTPTSGAPFVLTSFSNIVVDGGNAEAAAIGEMLAQLLRPSTGFPMPVAGVAAPGSIVLRLSGANAALGDEGYMLTITADSVRLVANRPAGLFHGIQTIRQLLPAHIETVDKSAIPTGANVSWQLPAVQISDYPRYSWRGAMLDVARHFFNVAEVKEYIDLLALYKFNVLHLHLSDDQGWRIQLRSRPRLTQVGSGSEVGGSQGGFFTQDDYQDLIRYAAARYILVVPEIDMPSHINAAMLAYSELSCARQPPAVYTGTEVGFSSLCVDNSATYDFVEDVVRELSALTPGPYFHIGGDEVKSLTPEQYVRFVEHAQTIVSKYGKRMIGWEEIAKARLLPTTIAQQWKSDSATAAVSQGVKLVMSPSNKIYLDMKYNPGTELGLKWAAYIEERDAYDWDPAMYLPGVTDQSILGVEAPIWSETVRNIGAVFYLALPRMPAVAEIGWTPQAGRNWESFRSRIVTHAPRWRYLGWNYYQSPQLPW
jgi:hexosaminidase